MMYDSIWDVDNLECGKSIHERNYDKYRTSSNKTSTVHVFAG